MTIDIDVMLLTWLLLLAWRTAREVELVSEPEP